MSKTLIMVISFFLLSACGPSCEEKGGKTVQDGFIYIWQVTNFQTGSGMLVPYPKYKCEFNKANNNDTNRN